MRRWLIGGAELLVSILFGIGGLLMIERAWLSSDDNQLLLTLGIAAVGLSLAGIAIAGATAVGHRPWSAIWGALDTTPYSEALANRLLGPEREPTEPQARQGETERRGKKG